MSARLLLLCALTALPASAAAADPAPAATDNVRIYRCVGSNGAVSLQDAPCGAARQQQVLDMQRPKDPPPRPAAPAQSAPATTIEREVRVVTVQPPQPMYECVTAEGERYTSDSNEGNPRWVPVWGYGRLPHPGHGPRPPGPLPGPGPSSGAGPGHAPDPGGGHRPHPPGGAIVPIGSTLVRDTCHALPPQEVCARLKDRRWELIRRYNSALQSERQQLVREQRGIEARLEQDCGGY
jgi:hypothetical protein